MLEVDLIPFCFSSFSGLVVSPVFRTRSRTAGSRRRKKKTKNKKKRFWPGRERFPELPSECPSLNMHDIVPVFEYAILESSFVSEYAIPECPFLYAILKTYDAAPAFEYAIPESSSQYAFLDTHMTPRPLSSTRS